MRRLAEVEIEAYDVLPRALAQRVRVQRFVLLSPGSSGMTLGRLILVRNDGIRDGTRKLLAHELVHVRQYDELGMVRFLMRYLRDYARALKKLHNHKQAYHAISFEIAAYGEAEEWQQRHQRDRAADDPTLP